MFSLELDTCWLWAPTKKKKSWKTHDHENDICVLYISVGIEVNVCVGRQLRLCTARLSLQRNAKLKIEPQIHFEIASLNRRFGVDIETKIEHVEKNCPSFDPTSEKAIIPGMATVYRSAYFLFAWSCFQWKPSIVWLDIDSNIYVYICSPYPCIINSILIVIHIYSSCPSTVKLDIDSNVSLTHL